MVNSVLIPIVIPVIVAFLLDNYFGDPVNLPHPIVYIGKLISFFTKILLDEKDSNSLKFIKGIVIVVIVLLIVVVPLALLDIFLPLYVKAIYRTIMLYYAIALKTLSNEALGVESALKVSLKKGQEQVARIVGRDTKVLDEVGVIKATCETVAENTSDGVIAPYFYFLIGGITGAYIYKVVNTFDSMIGYKNEKYQYFGKFAARFDDVLNLIPSRITGVMACIMAFSVNGSFKKAFKVFLRDRYKHQSPNSAQCESAFAGALGVELMGDAIYEGKVEKKEFINKGAKTVKARDISRSVKLMNGLTVEFVAFTLICRTLIYWIFKI